MLTTILTHRGQLSFKQFSQLIGQLVQKRFEYNIDIVNYKKLITLVIEVLENVMKYSDNFTEFTRMHPEFQPEFKLLRNGESYLVESVNPVKESDINLIRKKIDKVNSLDVAALKEYYRETIRNGRFTDKGGAGLGFIEIAKTASKPLSYHFDRISEQYYNFTMHMHIR